MSGGTVVITGGSRGLGGYIASRLGKDGYRVVALSRSGGGAAGVEHRACDVSDPRAVKTVCRDLRRDPSVFALINGAGIASMNLTLTTPADTVSEIIDVNLKGTIYCCQAIAPALIRHGSGRIINFSTIAVSLGLAGEAAYIASKAGVEGFSRAFAREMADHGCTVNCLAPGPVETDLIAKVSASKIDAIVDQQIIRRRAEPADVYDLVTLLLSPKAAMMTGEVLNVGGA